MAFGNRVLTATQDHILAKVVDTILNSNVLASRMLRKAKRWRGEDMKFPIKTNKGQAGSSFSGFDTFSTVASNTRQNLQFDPKNYEANVALPLDELSVNSGKEKVIDLMSLEMQSRAQDMADDIGILFYADGTGNSSKDFLGLEAIVDDGTNAATYGALARATYTTIQSTVTASGGTLTLAKLATLYNNVTSGSIKPTVAYTTEAIFSLYEQLLQPQERIMKDISLVPGGLKGSTGFTALDYKGVPVLADEKCTSQVFYLVNEDYLNFYAQPFAQTTPIKVRSADIDGNDYSEVQGLGFSWGGWIKSQNQAAVNGFIYLSGELLSENPKRHGKLTGITGV